MICDAKRDKPREEQNDGTLYSIIEQESNKDVERGRARSEHSDEVDQASFNEWGSVNEIQVQYVIDLKICYNPRVIDGEYDDIESPASEENGKNPHLNETLHE